MHIISIDTETGGFYPAIHALLSIGACCSWSSETFHEYITVGGQFQPGAPEGGPHQNKFVDEGAAKVNGYSWDEWERRGAVPLKTAMENLQGWLMARMMERPGAIIICHNAEFDRSHLREAERVSTIVIPHRHNWRCSQMKFGELMDRGVIATGSAGLDRLGVLSGQWPAGGRPAIHGALEDAVAALKGYQWLLQVEKIQEDALRQLYTDTSINSSTNHDETNVPFEIVGKKEAGRHLDGGEWNEFPNVKGRAV